MAVNLLGRLVLLFFIVNCIPYNNLYFFIVLTNEYLFLVAGKSLITKSSEHKYTSHGKYVCSTAV